MGNDSTAQLASVAGLLLVMSGPVLASERNTQVIGNAVYLQPQRLVAVEGHRRLNIYCTGTGSPAVVFDSGLGDSMMVWALVQPQVAAATRACSYDRAGLGFSDPSPQPQTSASMVDDLRRLLGTAGIEPPYLLVGHSLGGMNIKLYAETHLAEVAGLVFVDPSHEDLTKRTWALNPEGARQYSQYIDFLHECLKARPADFVAGSKLRQTCGTPPNTSRFSEAINALQLARATTAGYMAAWTFRSRERMVRKRSRASRSSPPARRYFDHRPDARAFAATAGPDTGNERRTESGPH